MSSNSDKGRRLIGFRSPSADLPAPVQKDPQIPASAVRAGLKQVLMIGIGIGGAVVVLLLVLGVAAVTWLSARRRTPQPPRGPGGMMPWPSHGLFGGSLKLPTA